MNFYKSRTTAINARSPESWSKVNTYKWSGMNVVDVETANTNMVVYEMNCSEDKCPFLYVGSTVNKLKQRYGGTKSFEENNGTHSHPTDSLRAKIVWSVRNK